MKSLHNKRVVITGGCGDIGLAVTARLAASGAKVIAADVLPPDAAARRLSGLDGEVSYVQCDTSSEHDNTQLALAVTERMGGVDVAIANAGISRNAPCHELSLEMWRQVLDVNLTGSFLFVREMVRMMLHKDRQGTECRGTVIFTGSWVGTMPWPTCANYCVSKAGIEMLMKVMAQELGPEGITCNVVAPGFVYAGLSRNHYDNNDAYKLQVDATVPLKRLCTAEELAEVYLFMASDAASYITGTTLTIDGGASVVKRDVW